MLRILVILILFPFVIYGQDISSMLIEWKDIHHKRSSYNYNWSKDEIIPDNEFKSEFFDYVYNDTAIFFCYDYEGETIESFIKFQGSKFHFLDIDSDNDIDVIYDGFQCPGYESSSVIIYINANSKTFIKTFFSGCVIGWLKNKNILKVYSYGCCDIPQSMLQYTSFQKDSVAVETLSFIDNILYYKNKMVFSDDIFVEMKMKVNMGDSLYFKPSDIYDGMMMPPDRNVFGYIIFDSTISYYYEYADEQKVKWVLCIVDCDNIQSVWRKRYELTYKCDKYIAWIKLKDK